MLNANNLNHILRELAQARTMRESAVLQGNIENFAEFRFLTGTIRGLVLAESIVKDLAQQLENLDE